ncbi:hypothetical protein SUNI508_05338 [Seiridium unicorne]|uniref:Uncharacterized protein n=1 Tax=Seiridium unicorne TaxID=138068 RepID=A0ABR2V4A9_9PEZI
MPDINQYMTDQTHMGVYNYQQFYKRGEIAPSNEARYGTAVGVENREDVTLVEVEKRKGVDEWGDIYFSTVFGFGVGSGIGIPYSEAVSGRELE